MYTKIKKCRICGNENLVPILDLGNQSLTGIFPKTEHVNVEKGPLQLVKCCGDQEHTHCGLVQLAGSYSANDMYGDNYGYRSGLNKTMICHLSERSNQLKKIVDLQEEDYIIDIGSNDSTLLKSYEDGSKYNLIGIDPTGLKFKKFYPEHITLISDFFSADIAKKTLKNKKAKIVTSIAMFYDLEDPISFAKDVFEILDDDGIWNFEQSYILSMINKLSYDTVCHEHLEYYGLRQIKWIIKKAGFKIINVEFNEINGGSFSVIAAKQCSHYQESTEIYDLLENEKKEGLYGLERYEEFASKVDNSKNKLGSFLRDEVNKGKLIIGYGASTKGNVLLQYCKVTKSEIPFMAEINEDKFGSYTPGTKILILSEKDAKSMNPDYFLVLPWHFKDFILQKEREYLDSGGKIIFPLPELKIYSKNGKCREII